MVQRYDQGNYCGGEYPCEMKEVGSGEFVEYFEYRKIKASHDKLVGVIQGALRIEDLWLINEPVNDQHIGEAEALARMKHEFEQALTEAEKIK